MKYDSILDTIGRTPVVRLAKLAPLHVNLYAKVESFNPMSSVKDRLALAVIEDAERSGALKPGQTVVEATSGNTGIGLAMVCARKGYPLVIVMAESFSIERRRLMRFLGAKVVLTPAALKGSGMLAKAIELAETHGWFLPRQFENEANADVHRRTTAQEILADFEAERLDYWVSGFGTGGTVKGVAQVLRAKRPETKIIVSEPENSALLGSGVPQPAPNGAVPVSHPAFRPHPIQGTTPDFISKLMQDAVREGLIDEVVAINGGEALEYSRRLATEEGIFVGVSAGAAVAAALKIAARAPKGANILCMLPDTGERYLSTPLFENISADMSEAEIAISMSTPQAQFGAAIPAAAPAPVAARPDFEAVKFFNSAIDDAANPIVLFGLEWCEFTWSVRKLFNALALPYRAIDLDSVAHQQDDLGGRIRRVLSAHTKVATIPQVFVGGQFVGGCSDIIAEAASGALAERLKPFGVTYAQSEVPPAETLLPQWQAKRRTAT